MGAAAAARAGPYHNARRYHNAWCYIGTANAVKTPVQPGPQPPATGIVSAACVCGAIGMAWVAAAAFLPFWKALSASTSHSGSAFCIRRDLKWCTHQCRYSGYANNGSMLLS